MRNIIFVCAIAFGFYVDGADGPEKTSKDTTLEDIVMEFVPTQQQLGNEHAKLLELKSELRARTGNGERLDLRRMENKLTGLYHEFETAKQKMSNRHPKTQETLRKLSFAAKMLTLEPEYFAENWERLLASR